MSLASELLQWYDVHARDLPWRMPPRGARPDPYHVWLSEIMLQQTTVAAVAAYYRRFLEVWPRVQDLAAADDAVVMGEWAGLGYYARARNLLKCARILASDGFPVDHAGWLGLPGVGPYTAAAIAAITYDEPVAVVDGNVERVFSRLFAVETPLPKLKDEVRVLVAAEVPPERAGDFAQATMDLGATICTPKSPACLMCPVSGRCRALAEGRVTAFPVRVAKKATPHRKGYAYVARRSDGAMLVETRPEKGLLGGMLGFPTGPWAEVLTQAKPFDADWKDVGTVEHTFTHFRLSLTVMVVEVAVDGQRLVKPSDLPTLMRKVHDVAVANLRGD
ncbi:MAG: A/G-specific adenine glycosylase [Deltaproteobacteria bacterium]